MTATILGPACCLPIGGGRCAYPAGHNGECDPNPIGLVWCDWAKVPARTDDHCGEHLCEHCGATDHEPYVDGDR